MRAAMIRRDSQGILNGPAQQVYAPRDSLPRDAAPIRPLHERLGFPAEGNAAVVGAVVLLLFHRGPATVARLVALRVIDAVNAVFRGWARPHIFKKRFVTEPPIAHRPSLIMASVREAAPYGVGLGLVLSPRMSVRRPRSIGGGHLIAVIARLLEPLRVDLLWQAPARRSVAEGQSVCWRDKQRAAIAAAFPHSISPLDADAAKRRQAVELLSGQIFRSRHEVSYG